MRVEGGIGRNSVEHRGYDLGSVAHVQVDVG